MVYLGSVCVDMLSGKPRPNGIYWRGDRLSETYEFRVNQQLTNLTLQVSTSKKVMGAWILVHTKPPLAMGSYAPRDAPYTYQTPPSDVPNGPGSFTTCGAYRSLVTFKADDRTDPVFERVFDVEIR